MCYRSRDIKSMRLQKEKQHTFRLDSERINHKQEDKKDFQILFRSLNVFEIIHENDCIKLFLHLLIKSCFSHLALADHTRHL